MVRPQLPADEAGLRVSSGDWGVRSTSRPRFGLLRAISGLSRFHQNGETGRLF